MHKHLLNSFFQFNTWNVYQTKDNMKGLLSGRDCPPTWQYPESPDIQ